MKLIWKKLEEKELEEKEPPDVAGEWVLKRATVITEVADPIERDSPLIQELEKRIRAYELEVLESLVRPTFFYDKLTKRRYMERSKPRPHEFGLGDAKSVLRRVRRGRAVSPALLSRAVKALVDEASYYNDY